MRNSLRLGRISGIEIGVHWSWFFIFFLLTWSLSTIVFEDEDTSAGVRWVLGTVTSVIFFLSVLIHELSHSLVAQRLGLPVRSITLFVFGGVSSLGRESDNPKHEFWIAILGPLTSLLLAIVFLAVWATAGRASDLIEGPAGWLALINFSLFVFNMMPGFPLDGGRVLRAVVWWNNGNHLRATAIASRTGNWLAWALIAGGVLIIFLGAAVSGLWLVLIGWFLRNASASGYAQTVLEDVLKGLFARDVATSDYEAVQPDVSLQTLVTDHVLIRHQRTFPVTVAGQLHGLITLSDIRAVPQAEWPATSVYRAMRPVERLHLVRPDTPLGDAVNLMAEHDVNQLPVVDSSGQLVGMVSRGDVLRLVQIRSEMTGRAAG